MRIKVKIGINWSQVTPIIHTPFSVVLKVSSQSRCRACLYFFFFGMSSLGVYPPTMTNFKVRHEYMKFLLLSQGFDIWKLVPEGCGENSISTKILQQYALARCIIYQNLHNIYSWKLAYLKYAKYSWDILDIYFGGALATPMENQIRKARKGKRRTTLRCSKISQKSLILLVQVVRMSMRTNQKFKNKIRYYNRMDRNVCFLTILFLLVLYMVPILLLLSNLVRMRIILRF